jgi:exopolysaccharide production protein ExoZ
MVVIYHLSWQVRSAGQGAALITLRAGVDIFFVISGFVMMYSTRAGTKDEPWTFLKRRIVRIAPLYWAATLFTVAVLLIAPRLAQSATLSPWHMIASFAFLPALSPAMPTEYRPLVIPGWTLNLEMAFYTVFAVAIGVSRGRPLRLIAAIALPLISLACLGLTRSVAGPSSFYCDPVILEFLAGALLSYARLRGHVEPTRLGWFIAAVAMLVIVAPPAGDILYRPFRAGIPALILVWAATARTIPHLRFLRMLGDASYSLYISHFFVVSLMSQLWKKLHLFSRLGSPLPFYVCSTVAAITVAILTWRVVEVPLTRLFQRIVIGPNARRTIGLRPEKDAAP